MLPTIQNSPLNVLVKHLEYQRQPKSQPEETVSPRECVEPAQTCALYLEEVLPESCWGI